MERGADGQGQRDGRAAGDRRRERARNATRAAAGDRHDQVDQARNRGRLLPEGSDCEVMYCIGPTFHSQYPLKFLDCQILYYNLDVCRDVDPDPEFFNSDPDPRFLQK